MVRPRGRPRKQPPVEIVEESTTTTAPEAWSIVRVVCGHPSGFLFLRSGSRDGRTRLDVTYCPFCQERRWVYPETGEEWLP